MEKLTKEEFNSENFYAIINNSLTNNKDGKCINAFEVLSEIETLLLAYNSIKSKPGNMVPGVDKETVDGINITWIHDLHNQLRSERWQPKPSRKVFIPKPNGKMRPLGISSPRDKIVQQAMKMTMETILEPLFHNTSHGFRPGRGCHTALKEIRNWKGVPWLIEGDIKNFFPSIDHHILENLLNKHFEDKRLINLYWKFVKAGYVEFEKRKPTFIESDMGVPQGGIISPLLSNLVLHELDQYMGKLIETTDKKNANLKPNLTNPIYHRLSMRINRLKKKILEKKIKSVNYKEEKKDYLKWVKERRKIKSLIPNPEFMKIRYVRYADDWLIGFWGNRATADRLKKTLAQLLSNLNLELSAEKTLITNTRRERAKFLGTLIKRMSSNKTTEFNTRRKKEINKRSAAGNLWMTAPILEMVKKLEDKEFLIRKHNKWYPKSIGKFTTLPIPDIIMRYNSIANGIGNYYSFVDNRRQLSKISWILKESLRKTIMRKQQITKKVTIRQYGNNISYNYLNASTQKNTVIKFIEINLQRRPMFFLGGSKFKDPLAPLIYKVSTVNSLEHACANCGSSNNIEMHHLKHIKTINTKLNTFDQMMAKINRKQVPLCRACHMEVHKGMYLGKSIKNYNKRWVSISE